jgi:hypothetical protein
MRIPVKRGAPLLLAMLLGCGGGGEPSDTAPAGGEIPAAERGTYLNLVAPSIIPLGEQTTLRLRVVTQGGLPDYDFEGAYRLDFTSPEVDLPENSIMEPTREGVFQMHGIVFREPGVQRIKGSVPQDTVQALGNPVVVMSDPEYRIYWGDLNNQSDLSSGARAPGVAFWYARAVALIDFIALTDNDREEALGKVLDDASFADVLDVADEQNEPGRFVTLPAFEWTSREHGNRLVYFAGRPEALPSVARGYDTPAKLRAALPAGSVVALAHPSGSANDPPTDPSRAGEGGEELVEIYSALGSFEVAGSHRASTRETPGASVADLLRKGFRPGFTASSDSRLTTPGNPRDVTAGDHRYPPGLTAVLAKELTRESILDALRQRRCYATTGRRYLLEFRVDGKQMGSEIRVEKGHRAELYGSLGANSKWVRAEMVGPAGAIASVMPEGDDADVIELEATTDPITEPTYVYFRGIDEFGGMAWSSPVYLAPE